MNIEKPKLIAGGFILLGCFLCLFGVYLSFGGKAEGQPVPHYLSTTNYNANTAISTSNTVIKRTNNASAQTKEKSLIAEEHPAPSAETKTQVESKPAVKETPPYPAPDGMRWTKAENGWILGYAKSRRNSAELSENQTKLSESYPSPKTIEPSRKTESNSTMPCSGIWKRNANTGVLRCIQ